MKIRAVVLPGVVSVGLVCLLASTGCQRSRVGTENTLESVAEAKDAIQAQAAKFSAAYVRGDVDEMLSIYTENGVAAPGGRDFIVGRTDMRSLWTIPAGTRILRHETNPESLVIEGNHAFDWGYYEGQSERDGQPLPPFSGKYVIVWERGDDNMWRMAVDMWNTLPAPTDE